MLESYPLSSITSLETDLHLECILDSLKNFDLWQSLIGHPYCLPRSHSLAHAAGFQAWWPKCQHGHQHRARQDLLEDESQAQYAKLREWGLLEILLARLKQKPIASHHDFCTVADEFSRGNQNAQVCIYNITLRCAANMTGAVNSEMAGKSLITWLALMCWEDEEIPAGCIQ